MSCAHSPFPSCQICRVINGRDEMAIAARLPTDTAPGPLPENRMTVEILQQMYEREKAEVRRLVDELAQRRIENDRLIEQIAELKRKARRKRK